MASSAEHLTEQRLPTGTVTFLFSDIEGSTRLLHRLGERYPELLEIHQTLLLEAFAAADGTVVGTEGDSFFVAFREASRAVAAALDGQLKLGAYGWPDEAVVWVRMGLHTGEGRIGAGSYVGMDVHRAARIAAAGHGGQVLISDSTRALVEHALPERVTLRDLGEHQLKDLLAPERIYQLVHPDLPEDFPPLASLTERPNNLPAQTSVFLGRESELLAIRELLGDPEARLITLTGPGGIGKTRLALQAAADESDRFQDGVYFVDLSMQRDADVAVEAIARAAGATAAGDEPPLDLLARQLADKDVLLVLDNFEQVMDATAPVVELLRRCRTLKVLVTSREALRARGERLFPVPPLSIPEGNVRQLSGEAAARFEAVGLFVTRAQETDPRFTLSDENAPAIAEICARLEGLPLAIELAAARLTLFSAEELRDRLRSRLEMLRGGPRDVPRRQRALREAIAWSYDLLDADERVLFQLLSVFASSSVEAVEQVAERLYEEARFDVVDGLSSLVDKSLVRRIDHDGRHRLSMFETIREFAAERLAEDPEADRAARQAHARYFIDFAAARREPLSGPERDAALAELDAELGNLAGAWRHSLSAGDLGSLDELLDTLWALHEARGRYGAAVELARDLLGVLSAAAATPERTEQRVALATGLARGLLAIRGYTAEVDEAYRQAVALLHEAGGLPRLVPVLHGLASLHLFRAEFEEAAVLGRRMLELAEQQGDVAGQVEAHLVLGANLPAIGHVRTGLPHLERAIELFDPTRHGTARFRFGPNPGVVAHTTAGIYRWLMGFPDTASRLGSEALRLTAELGHPFTAAYGLFHAALVDLWRRDFAQSLDRASEVQEIAAEHGYEVWGALALVLQGAALAASGEVEESLERSDRGMAAYRELVTPPVFWPMLLSVRARTFVAAARPNQGFQAIDEAITLFGDQPTILFPELPLIKGDLLLLSSGIEDARPWFERALEVGGEVEARMTQLRAATRLARTVPGSKETVERLRATYEAFTEGFDTPDLRDARQILDA